MDRYQQFSFWILLRRFWALAAISRGEQKETEHMVIKFNLIEPPLCLSQSPLRGKNGHGVVGLDAANSVRTDQVACHPTTLFQNENCWVGAGFPLAGIALALGPQPRSSPAGAPPLPP